MFGRNIRLRNIVRIVVGPDVSVLNREPLVDDLSLRGSLINKVRIREARHHEHTHQEWNLDGELTAAHVDHVLQYTIRSLEEGSRLCVVCI